MKTPNHRRQKLVFSTLGLALAVPLIAVPVSASVADGGFLVHAQNIEDSKYEAYAGIKGQVDPGDGSTDPGAGTGDNSAVLASYTCGPVGFNVTQAMVDFTKENQELLAAGRSDELKTNAEGWQAMSYFSPTEGRMKLGYPEDGTVPPLVYLRSTMSTPSPSDRPTTANGVLLRLDNSANCSITDARPTTAVADGTFSYWMLSNGAVSEGRYLQEDGALAAVSSAKQSDGALTLNRKLSALNSGPVASNTKPYSIRKGQDGLVTMEIVLKETVDGYNRISITNRADGSGFISYSVYTGNTRPDGSLIVTGPSRTQGPTSILWNGDGEITGLDGPNGLFWRGGLYTAAQYNEATGQNWDGSYQTLDDFDLSIPFEPTLPAF